MYSITIPLVSYRNFSFLYQLTPHLQWFYYCVIWYLIPCDWTNMQHLLNVKLLNVKLLFMAYTFQGIHTVSMLLNWSRAWHCQKIITCLTFKFCNFQNNFRQNPQWTMLSPAHVSGLHHSLESIGWRCTCKSDSGILVVLMFLEPEPHPQSLPTSLKLLGTQFRHVQWKWWYSWSYLIVLIRRTSLQHGHVSPKYSPKTHICEDEGWSVLCEFIIWSISPTCHWHAICDIVLQYTMLLLLYKRFRCR